MTAPPVLTVRPVTGIGEVRPGDDLAALLVAALAPEQLADGDVVVVTSKVVSKAEGRVVTGAAAREDLLATETDRVVARRGPTVIVRTRAGLVLAAAGIDASNTEPGTFVLLPEDADASARGLRRRLTALTGAVVAVVVSDTAGRAWRVGQTDLAVGAAGLVVLDDHAGRVDPYGNPLHVTAPAIADEVAAAADLVTGKTSGCPAAVVRGLAAAVLPGGEDGSGATALVRPEAQDMFGLGAREAVLQAVLGSARRGFGAPAEVGDLRAALVAVLQEEGEVIGTRLRLSVTDAQRRGRLEAQVEAVAHAHGWSVAWDGTGATAALTARLRRPRG